MSTRTATAPEAGRVVQAQLQASGRIGPNAITRVAESLLPRLGQQATRGLFERAGLLRYIDTPPQDMVDECEVIALHAALRTELGDATAEEVAVDAGQRTAKYLLGNRIPRAAQLVLKLLPAPLAARVLLRAIGGHSWTFAGSGQFSATPGQPVVLQIKNNPLCRGLQTQAPACHFYAAVFLHLFQVLVHPQTCVRETACEAQGDAACRFELSW